MGIHCNYNNSITAIDIVLTIINYMITLQKSLNPNK